MLKTAEFVTPLHPDKICDRIADGILDECLRKDRNTRAAIEVMGGHGIISVTGQLTTNAYVNIPEIVRNIDPFERMGIQVNLVNQSSFISQGVDAGGAGDQGIMIGYACNQNEEMVPQEYYLARSLCRYLYSYYPYDGKTQVTIDENNEIVNIIASFQNVYHEELQSAARTWLCNTIDKYNENPNLSLEVKIMCNTAGDWNQGGFDADTGVTGRKIVVDAYGPGVPVGGGAYSGKDPSKVDRSAAYMARYIAKSILKSEELDYDNVLVRLAYAIGYDQPLEVSVIIDGKYDKVMSNYVKNTYDLSPKGIIEFLKLKQIINYSQIASWGHYGNGYNWQKGI